MYAPSRSGILVTLAACASLSQAFARSPRVGTVTVFTDHETNTFDPRTALGAAVDGYERGDVANIYTPQNIKAMRGAGLTALTYRLRTELGVEAWHWNPVGSWSDAVNHEGYWTSSAQPGRSIRISNGYHLPRRGSTIDQANDRDYSRLDDGDETTFWKSSPYLDQHFTGDDNAEHPQWVVIDLGEPKPVDTIHIEWGKPYATRYRVEYWSGGGKLGVAGNIDATYSSPRWLTFPGGTVNHGDGKPVLRLCNPARRVRLLRIWMTESSSAGPGDTTDIRDELGYTIREIQAGQTVGDRFQDWIRHAKDNRRQTVMTVSSTDPWHRAVDRDPDVEQPGFDLIFHTGLTNDLPMMTPVGVLYDTPDNAAAELRWLRAKGYTVKEIEMGEEPDGQYVSSEDYAALYVQTADALHKVDPTLRLGGPGFQTNIHGWKAWPNASGNGSWLSRFLDYLRSHGHTRDFNFFSFEWYPFDAVWLNPAPLLAAEPGILTASLRKLEKEGLPRSVPRMITEYGYSAFGGEPEMDMPGAILNTDVVGQFLTMGGKAAYLYGYEPNAPICETMADTWGNLTLFLADGDRHIRCPIATYYATLLLTRHWLMLSGTHRTYFARSDVRNAKCQAIVTSYAVRRPDGQWSLLLLNKDPKQPRDVRLQLEMKGSVKPWVGKAEMAQYSGVQYEWHAARGNGYPIRNLPPPTSHRKLNAASTITLPPYSITVVTGPAGSAS